MKNHQEKTRDNQNKRRADISQARPGADRGQNKIEKKISDLRRPVAFKTPQRRQRKPNPQARNQNNGPGISRNDVFDFRQPARQKLTEETSRNSQPQNND